MLLFFLFVALTTATPSHRVIKQANECRTVQVQLGDSCAALAQKCGLAPNDFATLNADPHLCSTLQPGQDVCCSAGSLPDRRPKPNPDGSCAAYTAVEGDNCAEVGAKHGITMSLIDDMNHLTWGWNGCQNLQVKQTFCLSKGTPPMPAPIEGTMCGPQVPGTQKPSDMTKLADLNPCPLNVCCNKWGQCGTTKDFCIRTKSVTGNPGTSAPKSNGCISNCGMEVVNNANPPSTFRRIGYFEGWNMDRECLNMDASQIDGSQYDTIHFGFAEITSGFKVNVSDVQDQFDVFKSQLGFKKIISFGGWSFSTSEDSYPIFRESVTDANRATFAQNVADFVVGQGLDGVDFDWEYPGAPDIPGIPPGGPQDGAHYLSFLKTLRSRLPASKSISIAAPASYWYLKGFPIADMAKVVDYIIYMTYDLHGQWDYGNKWADEGCPSGSCLRSHVNYTETVNALAMITKAGVPASKVIVGVASYGRSFQLTKPGCNGPMCTFTGPHSGARPGLCTQTSGYISNAEIYDIIARDRTARTHYDQGSDSIILEYGHDQWVAYMDENTRKSRTDSYKAKNFGGTVDWAIDLRKFYEPSTMSDGSNKKKSGGGRQGKKPNPGHSAALQPGATCLNLEEYQGTIQPQFHATPEMWIACDTNKMLSEWVDEWEHDNHNSNSGFFTADFATPWGAGASFSSCDIKSICTAPDCNKIDHWDTEPWTGPALMIMVSFNNVMRVLENAWAAVHDAQAQWSTKSTWWKVIFDPEHPAPDATILKEIINSIAAATALALSMLDGPVAGVVAGLAGPIASAIATSVKSPTDDSVQNLADFEDFMGTILLDTEKAISTTFDDLTIHGHLGDLKFQDMIKDGSWVDSTTIPVLNSTILSNNQFLDIYRKHVDAAAVNWAWHKQRVWIMSYPMTQAEFDSHHAFSNNNEPRLKHYFNGKGHFLMSVFPDTQLITNFQVPRVQTPPGWAELSNVGFTAHDIIESSVTGFDLGGFSFNPIDQMETILKTNSKNLLTDSVSLPGIFTIPVCELDSSYEWTRTIDDFFKSLSGPGALRSNNDHGIPATFCWCLDVQDKNGKVFKDFIDLANWRGGSNPFCNPLFSNTKGPPKKGGQDDSHKLDKPDKPDRPGTGQPLRIPDGGHLRKGEL